MRRFFPRRPDRAAFTLIEVLTTLVILLLVLTTLLEFMSGVDRAWRAGAVDPFVEAETGFETIADRAANATLAPYQDYADTTGHFRTATSGSFIPDHLARRSDLAFVCGPSGGADGWLTPSGRTAIGSCLFFTAPRGYTQTDAHLGLEHLLNACGYFVEFGDETNVPGFILPGSHRWRWRLKQILQPSESLGIYTAADSPSWIQPLVATGAPVSVLADNVIDLLVVPEGPASQPGALPPNYPYDSRDANNPLTRHQLPARLRLVLVAVDEASAQIAANQNGAQAPAFVPPNLFASATNLDADLTALEASLTTRKIQFRVFQREILLPAAAWTNTLSQ